MLLGIVGIEQIFLRLAGEISRFSSDSTWFSRWCKKGICSSKILAEDADNEYAMLDATIVRVHEHSAG